MDAAIFLARDAFARFIGIELTEARPGYARAELDLKPHHLNGLGMGHGGVLFSLADLAFAAATNMGDRPAVAVHVSLSYIKAVKAGRITAIAEENASSRKLASYTARITDSSGDLLAMFQGTAYRMEPRPT